MANLDETFEKVAEVKKLRKQRARLKEEKNELAKIYHSTSSRNDQFKVYLDVMHLNEDINSLNQDIITLTEELIEDRKYFYGKLGELNV